jgi:MATE family multidrug resistance protein
MRDAVSFAAPGLGRRPRWALPRSLSFWVEGRRTLALALPMILVQVGQMGMTLVDTVMLGRVGTAELAAAAFVGALYGMANILGVGLLLPQAVLLAEAKGAQMPGAIIRWRRIGAEAALVSGGVLAAGLVVAGAGLPAFGQPPEVVAIVGPFLLCIALSLLPSLLFQADRQVAEVLGRPWLPVAIMLGGVGLNFVLNVVLIWGAWGIPALGLTGAGIATLVARLITWAVLYAWVRRLLPAEGLPAQELPTEVLPAHGHGAPIPASERRQLWRLGVPTAATLFLEGGAFSVAAVMVGWLGAVPLAAHQIVQTCAALSFMVPLGLAMAVSQRIGHAIGAATGTGTATNTGTATGTGTGTARDMVTATSISAARHRVRRIGVSALWLTVGWMTVCSAGFALAGNAIARACTNDPTTIALVTQVFFIVAVFQVADGVQCVALAALRGLSDVKKPVIIAGIAYWLVALPLGWTLGIHGPWGLHGMWTALALGLILAALASTLRFLRRTRKTQD